MICYLVRHGKDDESVRGGWCDASLCEEGYIQVRDLVSKLQQNHDFSIGRIYSSDLNRAMQSAYIINDTFQVDIVPQKQFREVNNGLLAGMKNEVAAVQYPGLYWSTLAWEEYYPGGESPQSFYQRVYNAWNEFKHEVSELPYNVMLVTHGGVMNVIQCMEHGVPYSNRENPFPIGYAQMIAFEI